MITVLDDSRPRSARRRQHISASSVRVSFFSSSSCFLSLSLTLSLFLFFFSSFFSLTQSVSHTLFLQGEVLAQFAKKGSVAVVGSTKVVWVVGATKVVWVVGATKVVWVVGATKVVWVATMAGIPRVSSLLALSCSSLS